MIKQTLSRQELYDLIWSTPFSTLTKRYSITHHKLKNTCQKMAIPLPRQGHWEKLKYNKPVEIIKLPDEYFGKNNVTLNLYEAGDQVSKLIPSRLIELEKKIIRIEGHKLKVPKKLIDPHKLIIPVKEAFEKNKSTYSRDGLFRFLYGEVNINVSLRNFGRALKFMDTFIKLMEKRGGRIYNYDRMTHLEFQGEKIQFRCTEKRNRVLKPGNHSWPEYDYFASGILTFHVVYDYKTITWRDGNLTIEKQFAKIIAEIDLVWEKLKQKRLDLEKYWAEQAEKRRIEEEEEQLEKEKQKRIDKERTDFKKLLKTVNRWHLAENLRNYIKKVEENAKGNNTYSDDFKKWIDWARKKADWYDPLISSADEYLIESDLDKLS